MKKLSLILLSLLLTLNLCSCSMFKFNEDHLDFEVGEEIYAYQDKYFYNQLNDEQKAVYKATYHYSVLGSESFDVGVSFSEELWTAFDAFSLDWPQYYWFQSPAINCSSSYITVVPEYVDNIQECLSQNEKIYTLAIGILQECYSEYLYDYTKNIHDYLINNVTYTLDSPYDEDYRGAFLDKACDCSGFSSAFQYLCNLAGIECYCVYGDTVPYDSGVLHQWNLIKIGENYYYVDVTWDNDKDDDGNELGPSYQYFLADEEIMNIDHKLDDSYTYPASNDKSLYYYDEPGLYVDTFDKSTLTSYISYWLSRNISTFSFKCANSDIYDNIIYWLYDSEGIVDIYRKYINAYCAISYGYSINEDECYAEFCCYKD